MIIRLTKRRDGKLRIYVVEKSRRGSLPDEARIVEQIVGLFGAIVINVIWSRRNQ